MLNRVSEEYYRYIVSRNAQQEKVLFATSEGVPVYSNTSNGYGILGSYSTDTDTITLSF
ncbi:MAG: DUF4249 family protein [Flavobacteriales bacterium]|nr:DUF4249 family protein [Flavobacteriales bacterium]